MLASIILALQIQGVIGFGYALDESYDYLGSWQGNITSDFRLRTIFNDKTSLDWVHRSSVNNGFDGDAADRDILIGKYRLYGGFGNLYAGGGTTMFRKEDQAPVWFAEYTIPLKDDSFYVSLTGHGGLRSQDEIADYATLSIGVNFSLLK